MYTRCTCGSKIFHFTKPCHIHTGNKKTTQTSALCNAITYIKQTYSAKQTTCASPPLRYIFLITREQRARRTDTHSFTYISIVSLWLTYSLARPRYNVDYKQCEIVLPACALVQVLLLLLLPGRDDINDTAACVPHYYIYIICVYVFFSFLRFIASYVFFFFVEGSSSRISKNSREGIFSFSGRHVRMYVLENNVK